MSEHTEKRQQYQRGTIQWKAICLNVLHFSLFLCGTSSSSVQHARRRPSKRNNGKTVAEKLSVSIVNGVFDSIIVTCKQMSSVLFFMPNSPQKLCLALKMQIHPIALIPIVRLHCHCVSIGGATANFRSIDDSIPTTTHCLYTAHPHYIGVCVCGCKGNRIFVPSNPSAR